jgi:predicted DNA-binding transcriptional regulator AlpA
VDEPEVAAVAEIAELLGVSRQRVYRLIERSDFPQPIAELSVGRVWRTTDIQKWARRTGRVQTGSR